MKAYASRAFSADKTRGHVKNKWVEESISLVIVSVVLPVKCNFNRKDIRLCIFWNLGSNPIICYFLTLNEDPVFWVSEANPEVTAIIVRTLEVLSYNINCLIVGAFNWTVRWSDSRYSRSIVVGV